MITSEAINRFIDTNNEIGIKFILHFDDRTERLPIRDLVWLAAANCDPQRDCRIHCKTLVVDARIKAGGINGFHRPWPNIVTMDKATIRKVNKRWDEYGIGIPIPSPSISYMPLNEGDTAEFSPDTDHVNL